MQRLGPYFTVLLALICFSGARNINLSRTELEAIAKVLNVALQSEANKQHIFLERFHGKRDHGLTEDSDDDDDDDIFNSDGNSNGNRNGNNGNNNGNVYLQIFIGSQGETFPPPGGQLPPPGGQFPPPGEQFPPPGEQFPPPGEQFPPPGEQPPPPGEQLPPIEQPPSTEQPE